MTNARQNGDSREAARMLAVSAYGASVWKTTTPSTVQSTLSDTHYQIAKLALGVRYLLFLFLLIAVVVTKLMPVKLILFILSLATLRKVEK